MFSFGKRILIHRKRSPFPPLGKVNRIRNFVENPLEYRKSDVFSVRYHKNFAVTNKIIECIPYLPLRGKGDRRNGG